MKANHASRTAALSAATRAWHTTASEKPLLTDSFALVFSPPMWRAIIRIPVLRRWVFERESMPLKKLAAQVIGRSRYAEDCLHEAIGHGTQQYVIIGAGYDSYALRTRHKTNEQGTLTVFELDHPATQAAKQVLLSKHNITPPENLIYVPVDFKHSSAGQALAQSAFDGRRKAFYSWLGTTPYLPNEDTLATLQSIRACSCQGSEIVFDYLAPDECLRPEDRELMKQLKRFTARSDEPLVGEFHPHNLAETVEGLGFSVVENIGPDQLHKRYFALRKDGLAPIGANFFMRCRVK